MLPDTAHALCGTHQRDSRSDQCHTVLWTVHWSHTKHHTHHARQPVKGCDILLFIIILQQVDGNIIGPKILGESTGLSPFWVVFAIFLGNGLFGVVGLFIGVPTWGVVYYDKEICELSCEEERINVLLKISYKF